MPSTSQTITSPFFRHPLAGTMPSVPDHLPSSSASVDQPVPLGVPVMITIPGRNVTLMEKKCTSSATGQIICEVLLNWRSSPLTQDRTINFWELGILSAWKIHGPIAALLSKSFLRLVHTMHHAVQHDHEAILKKWKAGLGTQNSLESRRMD